MDGWLELPDDPLLDGDELGLLDGWLELPDDPPLDGDELDEGWLELPDDDGVAEQSTHAMVQLPTHWQPPTGSVTMSWQE